MVNVKRVGEAKEKLIASSKILIEKDEKHLEDGDILLEQVIDDNLDYENMPSFNIEKATLSQVDQRGKEIGDEQRSYKNETPRTNLTAGDLGDISHNRMLNDSVINSFQQMLKFQYIHANGLQDPVLGQGLNFAICRNIPFVQILHDGNLHWVIISTYGCSLGEVFLMDSLFNGRIADHTKRQICSIVNYEQDVLKIIALPVQQQSNGVDCGVFAIAFISYILSQHKSPIDAKFNSSKMRPHLLHCLLEDKVTEFPRTE